VSEVAKANSKEFKRLLRKRIWDLMVKKGIATFPLPPHGRIPNFIGAEEAAKRLQGMSIFKQADVIKVNPDSPQKYVRYLVLVEGKRLVMPTPRISKGFLLLDPKRIPSNRFNEASTIRGAFKYGTYVHPKNLPGIDLMVTGSVVVDLWGNRLGKGEGYSELEFGILRTYGKVVDETPIVTTVHDIQIVNIKIPRDPWDFTVDYIITPTRVIKTLERYRPEGILWELLSDEKLREIPLLRRIKEELGV